MKDSIKTTRFKLKSLEDFVEKSMELPNTFNYEGESYRLIVSEFFLDDEKITADQIATRPDVIQRLLAQKSELIKKIS